MQLFHKTFYLLLAFFLIQGCMISLLQGKNPSNNNHQKEGEMSFQLKSSAFTSGEWIPRKYSCEGDDISPDLNWENIPEGTQSFAIICDDPDAPVGVWDHWLIYDIPVNVKNLAENINKKMAVLEEPVKGILQGINSWNRIGYGGPCPPPGAPHRYFFKIYALDTFIKKERLNKSQFLKEMENHVLGEAELMGKYKR
jgi:Raf kinase inhibitor-like YbhB/YbcL family protein